MTEKQDENLDFVKDGIETLKQDETCENCEHNKNTHDGIAGRCRDGTCYANFKGCKRFKAKKGLGKKPKVIILDDNEISIMKYAEEYPENWKKICKSLDKAKNHSPQASKVGDESEPVLGADADSSNSLEDTFNLSEKKFICDKSFMYDYQKKIVILEEDVKEFIRRCSNKPYVVFIDGEPMIKISDLNFLAGDELSK